MIKATKKNITLLSTMLMGPISLSLLIFSVYIIQPKVEAKLTSNVKSVLQENNILAEVYFSGRDGVLKGEVDSQDISEHAEKLSLSVFGTRTIRNQLNVRDLSLVKSTVSSSSASIENLILAAPEKIEAKESIKPSTTIVETVSNNKLSDIDKIMANMQKLSLLKPNYAPTPPTLVEKKPIEVANIQLISVTTSEKTPKTIEIKKADNSKEHKKPTVVIAMSNDVNNSEQTTKKRNSKDKEPNGLLDIIEEFNAFLAPPSPKVKPTINIKKDNSMAVKTLDDIDLSAIHFTDKSTLLLNESYATLDHISQSIDTYYHAPIDLIIYANDSDIAYARGVSIRDYLVKKGVKRSNIGVSGHTITADTKNIAPISIKVRK